MRGDVRVVVARGGRWWRGDGMPGSRGGGGRGVGGKRGEADGGR